MEKAAAGLGVLDIDGRFLEVNPALCELSGYTPEALVAPGFGLERLILPEEVDTYRRHLESLRRGDEDAYHLPQRLVRQDNVVLWVELTLSLLRDIDRSRRLVLTAIDITELKRAEDVFRNMSLYDPLTKLANRRLLQDRLQAAVGRAKRDGRSLALLFVDLDKFKPINDSLGHEVGDWLLRSVAQRLTACLREYDTAARFGGDEFVVLLPDLVEHEDVLRVAERIRASLEAPFVTADGRPLEISSSIGVALLPDHAENDLDLLHAGDEAMYVAKKSGRNRIVYSERTPTPTPVPVEKDREHGGLVQLTWEPSYASGNAFIDAEHRELFRHSNHLLDLATRAEARPGDLRTGLRRLLQSVESHFRHEEKILGQAGYAGLASHAARHRSLVDQAQAMCGRADQQAISVAEILGFLVVEMIHGHIITEDRDYFPSLKTTR